LTSSQPQWRALMTDPDLIRFLDAQDQIYQQVLKEVATGRKETHWMTAAARYHSWCARTDSEPPTLRFEVRRSRMRVTASVPVLSAVYTSLKTHKALPAISTSLSATSSAACLGLSEIILTRDGCAARNTCNRRTITFSKESRMA